MDSIDNLISALKHSPENIPLRIYLANLLLKEKRYNEAEEHFQIVVSEDKNNFEGKFGLAQTYFHLSKYSPCIVILEELLEKEDNNEQYLLLISKAHLKENDIYLSREYYMKLIKINPSIQSHELDTVLRSSSNNNHQEEIDQDELKFIEKPNISFADVGGMENVKEENDLKIIKPLLHSDLYKAYGKKIGGGILLYGPPGCGKTYLARATAGEINANFISVGINDVLDMWSGNSEKNLHQIFETARKNTPCVLFFDEIDALGASRSDMKQSSGRHLINQFLSELDGIDSNNDGVLILGATNTPWHLDSAFRRPGRFDRIIFVSPPDEESIMTIFKINLENKPCENIDYKVISKKTSKFSGADVKAVIDIAIEGKLKESFESGIPKPITTKDILKAIKRHKASTTEWFDSARNYALYSNESGLYDDILNYLKIKK